MASWADTPQTVAAMRPFVVAAYEQINHDDRWSARWEFLTGRLAFIDGDFRTAREAFGRSVTLRARAYGPDAPQTQTARTNLGVTLERLGEIDEAVKVYADVLASDERLYGVDSVIALRSRVTWAAGLMSASRHAEAEPVLRALVPLVKQLGERDRVFTVLDNLALIAESKGDWALAEKQRAELVELSAGDQLLTALSQSVWGQCLFNIGRRNEAITVSRAALTYFEGLSATHPFLALPLLTLARAESDEAKARALLDRAVSLEPDPDTRKAVLAERARRKMPEVP
jgi:tetratricopeptide (TPR) repeat protein